MSLYDLPATCGAHASSDRDAGCRLPVPARRCHRTATRRVIAYATTTPDLYAVHTEDTCDEHAEPLAAHWRRHGVRRPGKSTRHDVLPLITAYQRAHTGAYPTALAAPLPGMPAPGHHHAPAPRRRAVRIASAHLYRSAETGARFGRLDIEPSAASRLGKARREMVIHLARAYGCQPSPGMSRSGPWADRLSLQIHGDEAHIRALAAALPWTINAAESSCANAARAYTSWLRRRPEGDHQERERPALRTAWKRHYLPAWTRRWTMRMQTAAAGEAGPLLAGRLPDDADSYPAHRAADRDADEVWIGLAAHHRDRVRLAEESAARQTEDAAAQGLPAPTAFVVPRPPDPGGIITAPGVVHPPPPAAPVDYGRRTRYQRPLDIQTPRPADQLTLWPVPAYVLPVPRVPARPPRPQPQGRPLLDVLAGHPLT
ncbi:hypothetical protein ABTY59_33640 [Streptomyces sp. NPDC096079]|uniref:hypothetical protein n=1 Tax=Streptomyces sp. NPDC096079 TaxID=3155820 RepID=UPI00331B4145